MGRVDRQAGARVVDGRGEARPLHAGLDDLRIGVTDGPLGVDCIVGPSLVGCGHPLLWGGGLGLHGRLVGGLDRVGLHAGSLSGPARGVAGLGVRRSVVGGVGRRDLRAGIRLTEDDLARQHAVLVAGNASRRCLTLVGGVEGAGASRGGGDRNIVGNIVGSIVRALACRVDARFAARFT
ncbi:hypothetical protein ASG96_17245 [Terrabacter sp. Soil810]|nr:hypothetical protein ASG96_17245 [Terrabacter sp. Soil810]